MAGPGDSRPLTVRRELIERNAPKCGKLLQFAHGLEERIRRRAYEFYIQRGNQSGSELDDWLQAEDEIRQAQE